MARPTPSRTPPGPVLRLLVLIALTTPETAKVGAQLLASGSYDNKIRLWSAKGDGTAALIQTLSGHSNYCSNKYNTPITCTVYAVAFAPDGKFLASASNDLTIKLWTAKGDGTAAVIQTLRPGSNEAVYAVAFSPDGKFLASASRTWGDDTIMLWSAKGDGGDAVIQELRPGHSDYVYAVAFSPDGKLLASGSLDNTIKLWSAKGDGSDALIQTLSGHSSRVSAVAFSPDGKLLASGSWDNTIKLWSAKGNGTAALIQTLSGHSDYVFAVAFSPGGKLLASASKDRKITLWSAKGDGSDALIQTLSGHREGVMAVAFSPDGKILASASWDDYDTIKLWSAKGDGSDALIQTLSGHGAGYGRDEGQPDEDTGCAFCATGTFQDEAGKAACKPASCPPGQWGSAHPNCTKCDIGKYSPAPGVGSAEQCLNCPRGRWGAETGAEQLHACQVCPRGRFGRERAMTSSNCSGACPAGTFSIAGLTECLNCSKGWFSSKPGSAVCTNCEAGEDTLGNGAEACVCGGNFYYWPPTRSCAKCLDDEMDCSSAVGLSISSVPIKDGFWRSNTMSNNIKACPVAEACTNSTCASGHEGPFCMVCSPGYSRWQRGGLCQPCPAELGWGIVRSVASLVLVVGLLVLFLRLNRKAPNGAIKPFINASQMIQVLLMFEVDWPDSFGTLVSIFGSINLDAVALASPTCMGIPFDYHRRLASMVGVTALVLIAPWLYAFIEKRIRRHCRGNFCWCNSRCGRLFQRLCGAEDEVDEDANASARLHRATSAWETTMGYCLRDTILCILLVHPTLSGYALNFFNCRFVEELDGSETLNGRHGSWYMTADFSLRCYDTTYNGMLALAILLMVLFVCGIPVLFAFLLYKKRHSLEEPATKKLLGMLYMSYKPEAYWFESVQMTFKLALWMSLALFKDDPQLKIAIALLVCFAQVTLHAYLRPFSSFEKNASQALGICTAFIVSFGGLVINYLNSEMRNAYLLSNDELHAALKHKLGVFKGVLESIDLDDDEAEQVGGARNSSGGRRVWSFSQTSLAKEARDFQTVNPLHSPQFGEEEGGEKTYG
eukprot:g1648.t1